MVPNCVTHHILKFIRPKPNNVYCCHNPKGIRSITRLRISLNHLREHKFKHSFQDSLELLWFCGNEHLLTNYLTVPPI